MNRMLKVTRLHMNKVSQYLMVPPAILALVVIISTIIQLAITRATGLEPGSPEYVTNARMNFGAAWALPGFFIYYGVQAVATTYPLGLAFGATRRNFILGTMFANLLQSLYVGVLMVALLGIEVATGHWFTSTYVFDTYAVGAGDPVTLGLTGFIGTWFCLTVGGLFGAVWVRFGQRGPLAVGALIGLVLATTLLILAPNLKDIFGSITYTSLGLSATGVIVVSLVGTWFAMRRASVR